MAPVGVSAYSVIGAFSEPCLTAGFEPLAVPGMAVLEDVGLNSREV
jgi:hypothetical protein